MSAVPEYPMRHLVTAHEYLRMGETGVLEPAGYERIECVLLPEVLVTARELFPAQ